MENEKLGVTFYLILSGKKCGNWNWRKLKAERIVQKTIDIPTTKQDEIAIKLSIDLPEALFQRPELSVKIQVDSDAPRIDIDAETMDDMAENIQKMLGIPVHITCEVPET
ncbi:MAG: hypothetical protein GXP16_01475 [Gammaproteobacteria bacterium]|nr:hypothetical protein [Gammaproteobacteria bacterium]